MSWQWSKGNKIDRDELLYILMNEKISHAELGRRFGCSSGAIRQRLHRDPELAHAKKYNQALGKSSKLWYSKHFKCFKCEDVFEFKDKAAQNNWCKKCESQRTVDYLNRKSKENKEDGKYYIYYLPEEHYIGISNFVKRRVDQHKYKNKRIIDGWEVVAEYTDPKLAALHEALLHYIGYNGSAYDNMLKSKR